MENRATERYETIKEYTTMITINTYYINIDSIDSLMAFDFLKPILISPINFEELDRPRKIISDRTK